MKTITAITTKAIIMAVKIEEIPLPLIALFDVIDMICPGF